MFHSLVLYSHAAAHLSPVVRLLLALLILGGVFAFIFGWFKYSKLLVIGGVAAVLFALVMYGILVYP